MALHWWDTTSSFSTGVPFAVDSNGAWHDVDDVNRGKACDCYCAACRGPLVARQGEVRVHHFAHADRRECREALETSLFGMAIDILRQPGAQLRLPGPYDVESIVGSIGAERYEVASALKALGLAPVQSTLKLSRPVASCTDLKGSQKNFPDIVDDHVFGPHLLSTFKMLYMLERLDHECAHVLAINPSAFARGWFEPVCDR